MNLTDWWENTSPKKIEILTSSLLKRKYYSPDWQRPSIQWEVLSSKNVNKYVILLCKQGSDYAVFTDLIMPKTIPSDKFYGNIRDAIASYVDIIIENI